MIEYNPTFSIMNTLFITLLLNLILAFAITVYFRRKKGYHISFIQSPLSRIFWELHLLGRERKARLSSRRFTMNRN